MLAAVMASRLEMMCFGVSEPLLQTTQPSVPMIWPQALPTVLCLPRRCTGVLCLGRAVLARWPHGWEPPPGPRESQGCRATAVSWLLLLSEVGALFLTFPVLRSALQSCWEGLDLSHFSPPLPPHLRPQQCQLPLPWDVIWASGWGRWLQGQNTVFPEGLYFLHWSHVFGGFL